MRMENGKWGLGIGIHTTYNQHEYIMNSTSVIYHMVQKNIYTYTTVHA